MRRAAATLVASLCLLVLAPAAASAAVTVSFRSPEPDAMPVDPVEIVVEVAREIVDPAPERVTVALSVDGVEPVPGSAAAELTCLEGCDDGTATTSVWGGVTFDPSTLDPFGDVPVCNGRWWLLPTVEPADGGRSGQAQGRFVLSFAPSPVTDLDVAVRGEEVLLAWSGVPEHDAVGYVVERRPAGADAWESIAELAAGAREFRDRPGGENEDLEYRLVTVGPDGFTDGDPATACADRDPDLATPSRAWTVSLAGDGAATASPQGSPGPATSDGSAEDPTASPGDEPTTSGPSESGQTDAARSGTARDRIAQPPSASSGELDAPQVGSASGDDEAYFGEDEPFSEELDYSGVGGVGDDPTADSTPGTADTEIAGSVELGSTGLDRDRILRSVAAGLVLIAFALHLRRWTRES